MLDLIGVKYLECYTFRYIVTVWCGSLNQGIFPNWKFFDVMHLIRGSPLLDNLSGLILDLELCTREFLLSSDILFADLDFCYIVLHLYMLYFHTTIFLGVSLQYFKADGFGCCKTVRRLCLNQGVLTMRKIYLMCFTGRCPGVNNLVVCIPDLKFRPWKFFLIGEVFFGYLNRAVRRIKHFKMLDLRSILDLKVDGFCSFIAIRRCGLRQGIFSDWEFFDIMGLFRRSPLIYHIPFFILDNQMCPWQFFIIGDVLFGDCDLSDFITHGHGLDPIIGITGLFYFELDRICSYIAIGRLFLRQCINTTVELDPVCFRCRNPGIYNISLCITHRKGTPWEFLVTCNGFLGHVHPSVWAVLHGHFLYHKGILDGKDALGIQSFHIGFFLFICRQCSLCYGSSNFILMDLVTFFISRFNDQVSLLILYSRGCFLNQAVLSIRQSINDIWFLTGSPGVQDISIHVGQLHLSTWQFFSVCNVSLRDMDLIRLVGNRNCISIRTIDQAFFINRKLIDFFIQIISRNGLRFLDRISGIFFQVIHLNVSILIRSIQLVI